MKNVWKKALICLTIPAMLMGVVPFGGLAAAEQASDTTIESIQVNQVGYVLGMEKTFMVSRVKTADDRDMTFELINDTGEVVYTGDMVKEVTPYEGTDHEWPSLYYSGDFTEYDMAGTYMLTATCGEESVTSCQFRIGDATSLYSEALFATLAYFRGERDTRNTAENIVNQFDNNSPLDIHGAWYDASNRPAVYMGYIDNYNYMVCNIESNTSYQLFNAYEANPAIYDPIDYNHNGIADIIEEAVWGCDWYVRLKPALTGGYFYNGPENGKIHTNESLKAPVAIRLGAGSAIAALARAARYGVDGAFTAEEYGKHAKEAWDWYIVHNESEACEDGMEHLMDDIYWAVAALDMYQTFKEQEYLDVARKRVDAIMDRQSGDENFDGWYELGMEEKYNNTEGGPYHNWLDEAAVLYPLIDYAEAFPEDTARVARIKTSVEKYMDFKLAVSNDDTSGSNPYNCAKYYYREEVTDPDSTLVRFFQHENGHPTSGGPVTNSWVSGENGRLLSLTYASLLVGEFLETDKYLDYGLAQLNWVYGLNPFGAVMQAGIGDGRNLAEEIGHGGTVPYGAFINGIRGDYKNKVLSSAGYMDSRDYPFIDNSYWTGEWFLPIGTDAIVALTKLMATIDSTVTALPKDVPCEAEDAQYLLTTQNGSNKSNKNFEIMATAMLDASDGVALAGIDTRYEGAMWQNVPQATSMTIRYAAEEAGSFHLFVGDEAQTIYLPATGSADTFGTVSVWAVTEEGDTVSLQYLDGDTAISLDYVLFKDVSVTGTDHTLVTTLTGEAPIMPDTVAVRYSDDTSGLQSVTWQTPDPASYARAGSFTLTGVLDQIGQKVRATVTVYDIDDVVWIEPARVATPIGVLPTLPDTVTLYYPNGGALERSVTWDEITADQVASAGTWTGEGVVAGLDERATVTVTALAPFPESTSDLAYGKRATACSTDKDNTVDRAVDGDTTTRWASTTGGDEHQWFEVDLGQSYRIGSAAIVWEPAFSKSYNIQVSDDRVNWTTLYETADSDGDLDEVTFAQAGVGRYVRLNCLEYGHATWKGYSIYEFRVYGDAGAPVYRPAVGMAITAPASVLDDNGQSMALSVDFRPADVSIDAVVWSVSAPDGGPTTAATIDYTGRLTALQNGVVRVTATAVDGSGLQATRLFRIVGQSAGNLALGKTATSEFTMQSPAYAVDGDLTTRYGGGWNRDDQWFQVDLGSRQPFNRVTIRWENAYATAYELLVSDDNQDWTPVYTTTTGAGGVENIDLDRVQARYVRLHSTKAAMSQYGISIWEFEVYYAPDESATAADVAAVLEDWPSPVVGADRVILPWQEGFDVSIVSSSNEDVIALNGHITLPAEDTEVTLTVAIASQTDPTDTATVEVTLTLPGVGETWSALRQTLEELNGFEETDVYQNGSAELRTRYQAARQLAETADTKGREAEVLMELALSLLEESREALDTYTPVHKGDVDRNGTVQANDALLALQAATKKIALTETQTLAADVNGNGEVEADDALAILQYATKKITTF